MYTFAELTFLRGFSKIENSIIIQNINSTLTALNKETSNLESTNKDWAHWDDTYAFIKNPNWEYIKNNILNDTLGDLKLNFVVFINMNNEIVYSKGFNLVNNREEEVPSYIIDCLTSNPYIIRHTNVQSNIKGIVTTSQTPIIISSLPIITSSKQGPIKGTLIMGKYLDYEFISQLSKIIDLPLTFCSINNFNFPIDYNRTIVVKPLNEDSIAGYTVINDIKGNPSLILTISSERQIYKYAKTSKFYFTLSLFTSCLVFSIIALWLLNKAVLSPSIEQEVLLNTIPAQVYFKDKSLTYITGNSVFAKIFNIPRDKIRGKTDFELFPKQEAEIIRSQDLDILSSRSPKLNIERQVTLPDGNTIWASTSKAPYVGQDGKIKGMVGISTDVTEYKMTQEKIKHLAYYDSLTNLPNRALFNILATKTIAQSPEKDKILAILYIDLDKFKLINDTLGHTIGDELIKVVSDRLLRCIRKCDTLSRLGGDEFGVLLPNIGNKSEVESICKKVTNAMKEPWPISGYEINITISTGIVLYPKDGQDIYTLLKYADIAMYHAKAQGRNVYQFYTSTLSDKPQEELSLESNLLVAIKNAEFILYYQPQFHIKKNKFIGTEALIRWNNPQLGLITPEKFIPYAEKGDLILPIDEWVLKTACTQAKAWHQKGLQLSSVAVNLSSKQFHQRNLVYVISSILEETGLSPNHLEIEITEGIAMENPENTLKVLSSLKTMGIKIALDDFGTGYSSLGYLKRFPIDKLKIDKSFTQDMITNSDAKEIVKTIIMLAHNLKIATLAEGVETKEQLDFLTQEGCDEVQGYLFGKPMEPESLEKILSNWQHPMDILSY